MKVGITKARDDKKILIIISILIVLGIGLSSAYFLNKQGVFGVGSKTDVTTATLGSSTIKIEGTLNFNDLDILPGHKNISAIKLTATGDNELISYNLIWKGTNTLNTTLNYTVYKTTNKINTALTCKKVTKVENGKQILSEECSISNIESLGSPITTGTIETSNSETKIVLVEDEMITATTDGDIKYYYIILEYPNLDTAQNSDIGGSFDGTLTIEKGNTKPDVNIMAVYVKDADATDYAKVDDIPSKDLKVSFNASKSSCTNSATPIWNSDNWNITIDNLTKSGTSCYLYFDKVDIPVSNTILANANNIQKGTPNFTVTSSGVGLYSWTEGDYSGGTQTIQYFRNNIDNNWVVFGKDGSNYIWWRIIRNNSNGLLRMIYAGLSSTTTNAPEKIGEGTQIGTKSFNTYTQDTRDNVFVGFKYTSGQLHGNGTASQILGEESSTDKTTLYGWYNATLKINYSNYLDVNAGFCNDRTPFSGTGLGTTATDFVSLNRVYTNMKPSLSCSNLNDIFKMPIGLITADEVFMAGSSSHGGGNSSAYLCTDQNYWTMSPACGGAYPYVYVVGSSGQLWRDKTTVSHGVRPVINLKADTQFEAGGNGNSTNPYVVQGT